MHIIHEEGKPNTPSKYVVRVITIYLVYVAFFVVVFNLIMEWLALAIDAPIIMIALLFYLFIIIRHYRKYKAESLIYRIGEFGEKFYEKLISLFHYKKTIFLGISGMVVLHLLTDAISFIIPYIFIFRDTLYFTQLGAGHESLIPLFLEQIKNLGFLEQFSLFFVYLLNLIGILFFLIMPSIFWYITFTRKKFHLSKFKIGLIFSSILVFILAPVFNISRLIQPSILGVDIKTNFANNILYNNGEGGLVAFNGTTNSKFYNNTVTDYGGGIGIKTWAGSSNNTFTNNILWGTGTDIQDAGSGNIFTTNLIADPSFVNAAANDYRLQAESPAADAGMTLVEVTDDFVGTPRPQESAYDIGAFEYSNQLTSAAPLPPTSLRAD